MFERNSSMNDNFWPVFWTCAAVLVVFLIGFFIVRASEAPAAQNGYTTNLSKLVADYCSAPQLSDQESIRQEIISQKESNPDAYGAIPAAIHDEVESAISGDRSQACHY